MRPDGAWAKLSGEERVPVRRKANLLCDRPPLFVVVDETTALTMSGQTGDHNLDPLRPEEHRNPAFGIAGLRVPSREDPLLDLLAHAPGWCRFGPQPRIEALDHRCRHGAVLKEVLPDLLLTL